jgi:aspartyl-tRNA(Asn)/glutamyl-tRNA(Gln) amidotransferase subunit B
MLDHPSSAAPLELAQQLRLVAETEAAGAGAGGEMEAWCRAAIEARPAEAAAVRAGNARVLNTLVGHVMKSSRGRADALQARAALESMLR